MKCGLFHYIDVWDYVKQKHFRRNKESSSEYIPLLESLDSDDEGTILRTL